MMLANGIPASPFLAVAGTAVSELFAFFFVFYFLRKEFKEEGYHIRQVSSVRVYASEILRLSLPLTANRVILNLLRSVETVLIPFCLRLYGLTSGEALSTYGVLTGMALPLILFPSTITHSVSRDAASRGRRIQSPEPKRQNCVYCGKDHTVRAVSRHSVFRTVLPVR